MNDNPSKAGMWFSFFQREATPVIDDTDNPLFAYVGLGGEVGEFLNIRKKMERDGATEEHHQALVEEAGDVLFYLRLALEKEGHTLEEAAFVVLEKLRKQKTDYPPGTCSLNHLNVKGFTCACGWKAPDNAPDIMEV